MGSRLAFFTCLHRLSVRLSSPLGKIMYVEFPHTAWSDLSGLKSLSALRSSCCFDGCRNFFLSSSAVCISKSSLFAFSIFRPCTVFFFFPFRWSSLLPGWVCSSPVGQDVSKTYEHICLEACGQRKPFLEFLPEIKTWLETDVFVNLSAGTDTFNAIFTAGNKGFSLF